MKVFSGVIDSASSGAFNWSSPLDMRHAKNGFFNCVWNVTGAGDVTFAFSGSTTGTGNFITSTDYIHTTSGSTSGPAGDGIDNRYFSPPIFPFLKIGARAVGTTTAVHVDLVVG